MLDRLFDFVADAVDSVTPWVIIDQDEEAIVLRFGRVDRRLENGFHWVWPIVEDVRAADISTQVDEMRAQSMTTKDGEKVIISCTLQWRVNNIEASQIKIQDYEEAVPNTCYGLVRSFVQGKNYRYLAEEDINEELRDLARKRVQRFGVLVEALEVSDFTASRTIRLFND